jgi:hypothetical protein
VYRELAAAGIELPLAVGEYYWRIDQQTAIEVNV